MARKFRYGDTDFDSRLADFMARRGDYEAAIDDQVKEIINAVRQKGDPALYHYTQTFDRFSLSTDTLRVSQADISRAKQACDRQMIEDFTLAMQRIESYHRRQRPDNDSYEDELGVKLGTLWNPIQAVGLYVPGGTAAYPSSVLMNAIPAKVAGVERIMMTVPSPDGITNPQVLAAADLLGVSEIYRVGGAQAIAAMAYGTQNMQPVDKIVGPGNAYVAAAKRQVFGHVGIDMIAGPSEILVLADRDNDPDWIALDLLSQAEHDQHAQAILVTDDESFANRVIEAVDHHLKTLPRCEIAHTSWHDHGAAIIVQSMDQAIDIIDKIAPEHLELALENAHNMATRIRNAGAIFIGRYTPEAVGDYVAGPNHVLPTSGSARFSSGLSVYDFLTRSSFVQCDSAHLRQIGPGAVRLARIEGLDAHARSIAIRLNMSIDNQSQSSNPSIKNHDLKR